MHKKITTLFVSEPAGVSYMLGQDQFEQIDEFHVQFSTNRDVTLKDIVIESSFPVGDRIEIESIDVKLIERVTATIVDVYGKLETRNVEENVLDLEFVDVDRELNVIEQWLKTVLISMLNYEERFEKLVGNVSVIAK